MEYWDRYMRDGFRNGFPEAHHYIEWNPVKAHLRERSQEDWPFTSANPKWQWNGPDRYQGAHLVKDGDPGFSCHVRTALGRMAKQADKNDRSKQWKNSDAAFHPTMTLNYENHDPLPDQASVRPPVSGMTRRPFLSCPA